MKYVGMYSQIRRNNRYSALLLLGFPVILLGLTWVFLAIISALEGKYNVGGGFNVNEAFLSALPWVVGIVGVWFIIAYFCNAAIVKHSVNAQTLERKENPRVYNIVENLCMSCGMDMPKLYVVDDPQLNAFASGINKNSYAVTLTTGIINMLDDDELAGVVGHELTHIRNKDTRLLITGIVFVGIVATLMQLTLRAIYYLPLGSYDSRDSDDNGKGGGISFIVILIVGLICCAIAYVFTLLTRFAISRKREFMADAGGAELCGNPLALASALRKISGNPGLDDVSRADVAQLFIMRPDEMKEGIMGTMDKLFSTHPDPEKRIAILEQF